VEFKLPSLGHKNLILLPVVAMPLAIAALGMLWGTSRVLDDISASVNALDERRTWQEVQSAVAADADHLANTLTDNAHWDDAVTYTYGTADQKWLFDTWGSSTSDINYDTAFVTDADGHAIAAFHDGELFAATPQQYFGKAFAEILRDLPNDNSTFASVSTLVATADGVSVMAAGPILPYTAGATLKAERPDVLIFARRFTRETLAHLSRQYVIANLALAPAAAPQTGDHVLRDRWGHPVAVATWQPNNPGAAVRNSYFFSATLAILALLAAMLPSSIFLLRVLTRMENNERRALVAARHDSLSGLPNRSFVLGEIERDLSGARPGELALMFIDLDGFKFVNDVYDHETGDKLIMAVAAALSELVAGKGRLARLGGDEFAVLVRGADALHRARALATALIARVGEPFDLDGRSVVIGASIGIAALGEETLDSSEFMRRADVAMYRAKDGGRNRAIVYDQFMDIQRKEDAAIARELKHLLDTDGLAVAYQPIVDAQSHAIVAVEALARWPGPAGRDIDPRRFVGVAEEYGMIDRLGLRVLEAACRDMARWPDLRLSVNLSPLQFNNRELAGQVLAIAAATGMAPGRIEVEISETALMRNPHRARQMIDDLKAAGVSVALDRFGTGSASIGHLRNYGFDRIKLDRALARQVCGDPEAQQVVQGTLLIARALSAEIVAEGIESDEEARLLRLAGCRRMQGYYFFRPQSAEALAALMAQQAAPPVAAAG
jgi:diguanylate cyclase (GGDEF)-like protein